MKKFFSIILCLLSIFTIQADDVIVLRNSTRIDAKILEVSDTEIKYKKANNLNGPTFIQKVETISVIIYENGDVVSYADQASRPVQQASNQSQIPNTPQESKVSNTSENQADEKKNSKKKLQFNPQPSDNYITGITIGYVSKTVSVSNGYQTLSGSWFTGQVGKVSPAMRVGLTVNPTFKFGIGLRTGLNMEYAFEAHSSEALLHDITLSVPLQLSYRYELIPKLSFMLYTGPVFDFGAYMSFQEYTSSGWESSENLYGSGKNGYFGFNALWGIGAGIQWDHLRLDVGGELGMVNKVNEEMEVAGKWNKPVYVTLTWLF